MDGQQDSASYSVYFYAGHSTFLAGKVEKLQVIYVAMLYLPTEGS